MIWPVTGCSERLRSLRPCLLYSLCTYLGPCERHTFHLIRGPPGLLSRAVAWVTRWRLEPSVSCPHILASLVLFMFISTYTSAATSCQGQPHFESHDWVTWEWFRSAVSLLSLCPFSALAACFLNQQEGSASVDSASVLASGLCTTLTRAPHAEGAPPLVPSLALKSPLPEILQTSPPSTSYLSLFLSTPLVLKAALTMKHNYSYKLHL